MTFIFTKKSLSREIRTKQISTETCTKKYWTQHVYHKLSEKKSLPDNFRKKPPTKKKTWTNPNISEEKSPPNKSNILHEYIWRKIIHQPICDGKLSTQ